MERVWPPLEVAILGFASLGYKELGSFRQTVQGDKMPKKGTMRAKNCHMEGRIFLYYQKTIFNFNRL